MRKRILAMILAITMAFTQVFAVIDDTSENEDANIVIVQDDTEESAGDDGIGMEMNEDEDSSEEDLESGLDEDESGAADEDTESEDMDDGGKISDSGQESYENQESIVDIKAVGQQLIQPTSAGITVSTAAEIQAALDAGNEIIIIANDVDLDGDVLNIVHDVTFIAGQSNGITITQSADVIRHMEITDDSKITFDNIILNGNGVGGGIQHTTGVSILTNVVIKNCFGTIGGAIFISAGTLTMESGEIIGNISNSNGGGVYIDKGSFYMNSGRIVGNSTKNNGGGVYNSLRGVFVLNSGEISHNVAEESAGGGVSNGGGISELGTFIMLGGTISSNTAKTSGGGVNNGGNFTMEGGTVSSNTANQGAGIHNSTTGSNGGVVVIKGGEIIQNIARSSGGGLYNFDGQVMVEGGQISENTAASSGGGIYFFNGTVSITGGEISANKSEDSGGGIYFFHGTCTITGGKITKNASKNGGGIYARSLITVIDGEISKNISEQNGGGIYFSGVIGTTEIQGGKISDNVAGDSGGGIYNSSSDNILLMTGCEISGNFSQKRGGGIDGETAKLSVTGGRFRENRCGNGGYPYNNNNAAALASYNERFRGITELSKPFDINSDDNTMNKLINNYDIGYFTISSVRYFIVDFDINGGYPIPEYQAVAVGEKIVEPQEPKRDGFVFNGWFTENEEKWDFENHVMLQKDLVLTAKWKEKVNLTVKGIDEDGETVFEEKRIGVINEPITVTAPDTTFAVLNDASTKTSDMSQTENELIFLYTSKKTNLITIAEDATGAEIARESETIKSGRNIVVPALEVEYYSLDDDVQKEVFAELTDNIVTFRYMRDQAELKVIGLNQNGEEIYKEPALEDVGSTVTVSAPEIERYILTGDEQSVKQVTIGYGENKVVFAYQPSSVLVLFDVQASDATSPSALTLTYGEKYGTLPNIIRTGFMFTGWYFDAECEQRVTAENTIELAETHTLFAGWKANEYTVFFNPNASSISRPDNQQVLFGNAYGPLPRLEYDGYIFGGWFLDRECTQPINAETIVKTADDHTLHALWTAQAYTIFFDPQADDVAAPANREGIFGSAYGTLPLLERTGYTFDGWFLESNCQTQVSAESIVSVAEPHTLYGKWTANTYTLHFDSQAVDATVPTPRDVVYAQAYGALPVPARKGYTFNGWSFDEAGQNPVSASTIVTTAGTHTVYAQWTAQTVDVSFDTQSDLAAPEGIAATYHETYGTLPDISRTGYTFGGWYREPDCVNRVYPSTQVVTDENHVLYAKWTANTYTLSFDSGAGDVTAPDDQYVTFNMVYGLLPSISRVGYTFNGWYFGDVRITNTTIVKTASDHAVFAKWTANTHTVSFDPQAADVAAPEGKDVTYSSLYGELPEVSRTGYTFAGWFLESSCLNRVTDTTVVETAEKHTLFAKWTPNSYLVSFDIQSDGIAPEGQSKVYGESYGLLPSAERTGYTFAGWFFEPECVNQVTTAAIMQTAQAHIVYAKWMPIAYTVSFDVLADNAIVPASIQVIYDDSYGALPTSIRTGYSFSGWYFDKDLSSPVGAETLMTTAANHTLYAKWTAEQYAVNFSTQAADVSAPEEITVTYDSVYGPLPSLERAGYAFAGWYLDTGYALQITEDLIVRVAGNHMLYAKWIAVNVDITFDTQADDVDAPEALSVEYMGYYGSLPAVSRTGYTFKGWYLEEGCTNQITASSVVMNPQAHKLYAKWEANTYSVRFDTQVDDVAAPGSIDVVYDKVYGALPALSRTGYDFEGWFLDLSDEKPVAEDTVMQIAASHTLYAKWKVQQYEVRFETQADVVEAPADITVTYREEYGVLPMVSRTGYAFTGWYLEVSCINEVQADSVVGAAEAHTLYAGWKPNTYVVSFDTATTDVTNPDAQNVVYDMAYGLLPTTSRTGYTFTGWFLDGVRVTNVTIVLVAGNHTLTAGWAANTHTVSFDPQAADVMAPVGIDATFGTPYGALPVLSRTGYLFDGWYKEASCINRVTEETLVTTPDMHTLYAKWTADNVRVSFDVQYEAGVIPEDISVSYHGYYAGLPAVSREGYTFVGWYLESAGMNEVTALSPVLQHEEHTLYAKWAANEYTISFDTLTAGIEIPLDRTVKYDSKYGSLPVLSRTGYTFSGWYLEAECQNKIKTDAVVKVADNHMLFAGWQANRYVVAFDTQTDSVTAPAEVEVTYDAVYGVLPQIERTGYTFEGWSFDLAGEQSVDAESIVSKTAAHTLYAQWTANTYIVSFDVLAEDVEVPMEKSVVFDRLYGELPVVVHTGYVFGGWFLDEDFQHEVTDKTLVFTAENHTLFARWLAEEYTLSFDSQAEGILNPEAKEIIYEAEYGELPLLSRLGYTFIGWAIDSAGEKLISSNSVVEIADNHTAYAVWEAKQYTVSFVTQTEELIEAYQVTFDSAYGVLPVLERSGYTFDGWFIDETFTESVTSLTLVKVASDHSMYAKWSKNSGSKDNAGNGGGAGGGGSTAEEPTEGDGGDVGKDTGELDTGSIMLKKDIAYITGYADGTVRPNHNLTRAETSMIFYRLLEDNTIADSSKLIYIDIGAGDWHANAVATLSNLGILSGYPDCTFRAEAAITRAEFAAIVARFDNLAPVTDDIFSDVAGHWAADSINRAAKRGWINGYPDGTFRPDQIITRAEAMSLINNILGRKGDEYEHIPGMLTFSDNKDTSTWYYAIVQQAANGITYDHTENEGS